MSYALALAPLLVVLSLMIGFGWGGARAGLAGWCSALIAGVAGFGLTVEVLFVSQLKGLLLSLFVLGVMWPALFLFHWHDRNGGTQALVDWLKQRLPDSGFCALLLAWALSGAFEGLAGFGLPIAIVSPMLCGLGVPGIRAVAAVAVGHAWSVTFGDMGIILQVLVSISGISETELVGPASLLLGVACLGCGMGTAMILDQMRHWKRLIALSAVMGFAQFLLATIGLIPLAAFGAGSSGLIAGLLFYRGKVVVRSGYSTSLIPLVVSYGGLTAVLALLNLITPWRSLAGSLEWRAWFPEVITRTGFLVPAGFGQAFRPLLHPGALILLVSVAMLLVYWFRNREKFQLLSRYASVSTWRSAGNPSLAILLMVGLATLMEHTGMTLLLAQGTGELVGRGFPLVSTYVGMLGAFATGSNTNSNIIFAGFQKELALLLQVSPAVLLAAQTAGGSLGSLLSPAKIAVGCSTTGLQGKEGEILRLTVPYGVGLGFLGGVVTLLILALG